MTHSLVRRPLRKFYFCHQLRLHPLHRFVGLGLDCERALIAFKRLKEFINRAELLFVEAAPDMSHILKLALTIQSHHQRTEIRTRTTRLGVTADHDFRSLNCLYFEPV